MSTSPNQYDKTLATFDRETVLKIHSNFKHKRYTQTHFSAGGLCTLSIY
jgi:hypothetical protein